MFRSLRCEIVRAPSDAPAGGDAIAADIGAMFSAPVGDPSPAATTPSPEPVATPAPTPTPQAAPPSPQQPVAAPPADPSAQPGAPPSPAPDPNAALAAAAAALAQTAQNLPDAVRAATQPTPTPGPAEDPYIPRDMEGNPIDYGQFQIPDQIIAAMASENPLERKQATVALLSGVSRIVHQNAVRQTAAMLQAVLPQVVQRQVQGILQQKQVFDDFYNKFPQLNHQAIRPIVMQEAVKLAQQQGAQSWTPQFRDNLGQHITRMLGSMVASPVAPATAPAGSLSPQGARPPMATPQAVDPNDPRSIFL